MKLKVQRPRGMKDIVAPESEFYLKIKELIIDFSLLNGFKYIETPVVEDIKTFTISLGETSDVVSKEMFVIKGKEKGASYVLRPEGTAGVVRAYFENGMASLPQPVSLFYIEKMYRRERPQHGRLREHTQWGLEILNTEDAFADFFVIFCFYKFLTKLKIENLILKLNSIGCRKCRERYRKHLVRYYKKFKNKICNDCQRRLKLNPLRILDCKNPKDQEYKKNAPNILDHLCRFCENHFQKVIEFLDHSGIPYELDKTLVRGFDYYQRTVFEIFIEGENFALGGGGRYDLGEILANQSLPSVGGALGLERLKIILDEINFSFKVTKPKIFIAFSSEEVKTRAFDIYLELQDAGTLGKELYQKLKIKVLVLTLGNKGSLTFFENKIFSAGIFKPKKFVDPTGAGDAFASAFFANLVLNKEINEQTIKKAIVWGSANASANIEKLGAQIGLLKKNDFFKYEKKKFPLKIWEN